MTAFPGWDNFYVILGSSAGALIGLQFVVLTLVAQHRGAAAGLDAGTAFNSPTIVDFGVVLFLSAIVAAPWQDPAPVIALWFLVGIGGIFYSLIIIRRFRRQSFYRLVFYDWFFYGLLPVIAYSAIASSAAAAAAHMRFAPFAIAGAALLLLFTGIHNAWDLITYHVFVSLKEKGSATKGGNLPPA
jgi:hypothetical protein